MKKILWISALALIAVAVLGVAGFAYAQTQTPPDAPLFGFGMMRRNGGFGPGMMRGWGQAGYGPMHTYMVETFAEALGLTPEELQARLDDGETMYTIAQAQGLSDEEFSTLMVEARTKALEDAVADGVLTQEQADWMVQHMAQMQASGFGPGNCPMHNGANGQGRGPGWRWNNQ
jgi:hypothetical protein